MKCVGRRDQQLGPSPKIWSAIGPIDEPGSAIGPIDVEDRVIHSVEVCCCGPEQEHADGRMNGLEVSLYDEAHRRAPGSEVESVVWTLCVVNMNRVLSSGILRRWVKLLPRHMHYG